MSPSYQGKTSGQAIRAIVFARALHLIGHDEWVSTVEHVGDRYLLKNDSGTTICVLRDSPTTEGDLIPARPGDAS
jgi:hypothetical protein